MAIIENRAKDRSLLTAATLAFPDFCRRISIFFFILLSLQLLYILPEEHGHNAALEFSGSLNSGISGSLKFITNEFTSGLSYLEYLKNLREENIALKLELARLKSIEQKASTIDNENKSLRAALKFANEINYKSLSARIVSIATHGYSQSALVQAGGNQGVQKEQVVLGAGGLIGRIIDVSNNYSKVMLVTDFGSRIPVVSSHSRLQAVVTGAGDRLAKALYLPEHSGIQVGETLLTSGDGKHYPSGLPVAKVSRIENGEVYVTPLVDLSRVDFVSILQPAREETYAK